MEPGEKVNILVVDDEQKNLLAFSAMFEKLGENLVTAASGEEALKCLLEREFAVILMDVQMPGMDGFETAARIRAREKNRYTPIIFITAINKEDSQVFRGYWAGAVDYVFKPIDPEILRWKVSVFVNLFRKTQEVRWQAAELARMNAELEAANKRLGELYQRVKELDRAKSHFFANLSHEFRTPLALILGPTEKLLAGSGLNRDQRQSLEAIRRNARTLLRDVSELLDVSRLEAGQMDLRYRRYDLAELVRLTAANFDLVARERRITFSVHAPEVVAAELDPDKIERVLVNLLSNAFKFTPEGGVVECALRSAGDWATIDVQDSGPGVAPEQRKIIFERFRQAQGGARGAGLGAGGTGLGLSIAKEFVELHGGAITVREAPAGGALFRVELPVLAPAGVRQAQPPQAPKGGEIPPVDGGETARQLWEELRRSSATRPISVRLEGSEPLVLVVEDNLEMNRFLCEALEPHYRTAYALDGEDGLAQAISLRPDLVLLDLMMPRMDGEQFLRAMRGRCELDAIPVVVLTAHADEELRVALLRKGAQDYLLKPFAAEELLARVANLVTMKQIRELLQREVTHQERDVVALIRDLLSKKEELETAHAVLREQAGKR